MQNLAYTRTACALIEGPAKRVETHDSFELQDLHEMHRIQCAQAALESIPGPYWRPAFAEKRGQLLSGSPHPRPLSRTREREQCAAPSPACGGLG